MEFIASNSKVSIHSSNILHIISVKSKTRVLILEFFLNVLKHVPTNYVINKHYA